MRYINAPNVAYGEDRRTYKVGVNGVESTDKVFNVSYDNGRVEAYLNGVRLFPTDDYTKASSGIGTSITLISDLGASNVLEIVGYQGINSGNALVEDNFIVGTDSTGSGGGYDGDGTNWATVFPVASSAGDSVSVWRNGVKLVPTTDFTVQPTTSKVTLGSVATIADEITVQVVGVIVNNDFPLKSGMTGAVFNTSSNTFTMPTTRGSDGQVMTADGAGASSWSSVNLSTIEQNIAMLGFYRAADHSKAYYSLVDQVIDTYSDGTGIDTGASTNELLSTGSYSGGVAGPATGGTRTTVGSYEVHTFLLADTGDDFSSTAQMDIDYLVVAGGGGGGGQYAAGGGGAGGFRTAAGYSLTAGDHEITVGVGGSAGPSNGLTNAGSGGDSSIAALIVSDGGGGGSSYSTSPYTGVDGGSGGGGSGGGTGATAGGNPTSGQGSYGGNGASGGSGGGGGGASANGVHGSGSTAGSGGAGENNIMGMNDADSDALLTTLSLGHDVGDVRYFAGGGGGGANTDGTAGAGGSGGGGAGGVRVNGGNGGTAASANTGGGGGGSGGAALGGAGGSGIVVIRYLTADHMVIGDLVLQSVDTEAEVQPTKADLVMLVEDAGTGVATINTHIKGWVSRDSGTTFTQGTLIDEGDWGTDKRILAFHDLDISGQPSDKTMCYKITTHSASTVYDTKIHATSLAWA